MKDSQQKQGIVLLNLKRFQIMNLYRYEIKIKYYTNVKYKSI